MTSITRTTVIDSGAGQVWAAVRDFGADLLPDELTAPVAALMDRGIAVMKQALEAAAARR